MPEDQEPYTAGPPLDEIRKQGEPDYPEPGGVTFVPRLPECWPEPLSPTAQLRERMLDKVMEAWQPETNEDAIAIAKTLSNFVLFGQCPDGPEQAPTKEEADKWTRDWKKHLKGEFYDD